MYVYVISGSKLKHLHYKTTVLLIGVNVTVYGLLIVLCGLNSGMGPSTTCLLLLGLHPLFIAMGEWWRLLTSLFVHIDFLHLFFNMYALYIGGRVVEPYYGSPRFLAIYFLSGIIGNIASLILPVLSVGASGAVFGVFGAMIVVEKRLTGTATAMVLFLIIVLVVSNLAYPGKINNIAHIAGVLAGYVLGKILEPRGRVLEAHRYI